MKLYSNKMKILKALLIYSIVPLLCLFFGFYYRELMGVLIGVCLLLGFVWFYKISLVDIEFDGMKIVALHKHSTNSWSLALSDVNEIYEDSFLPWLKMYHLISADKSQKSIVINWQFEEYKELLCSIVYKLSRDVKIEKNVLEDLGLTTADVGKES